tara:strand:- start:1614 stop:1781 length:168 start_codon:yes stop_codon:yes gene_type:complete
MDAASILRKIPKMGKPELIALLAELRALEHEAQRWLAHRCGESGCDGCKDCKPKS